MHELQEAIERVIAGPERRSRLISEKEKRIIAFHEAGHALVQLKLEFADPVHKVSIVSRGMMGGYTMTLPEDDRTLYSRSKFADELAGLLGGRVAEEIVFGDVTTGASNDLRRATHIARAMVTEYGMAPSLGQRTFGEKEELIFLGREISEQRDYSEQVATQIDHEIKSIIDRAYERSKDVLETHRSTLEAIATLLIEKETIESPELEAIVNAEASVAV
jgi:cell division protease FtsH